jgi:hypothetical protein
LLDLIGFLYEIRQSTLNGIDPAKKTLVEQMYARQKETILSYASTMNGGQKDVEDFLSSMNL